MKKSQYHKQATTCDLEMLGYVSTFCDTVGEFVEDAMESSRKDHYTFIILKPEKVTSPSGVTFTFNRMVAKSEWNNGKAVSGYNWDRVKDGKIRLVRFHAGWGGTEFKIELKTEKDEIQ